MNMETSMELGQLVEKVKLKFPKEIIDDENAGILMIPSSEHQLTVFESAGIDFFQRRRYKGLVPEVDEDVVSSIVQGKYGIASDYCDLNELI